VTEGIGGKTDTLQRFVTSFMNDPLPVTTLSYSLNPDIAVAQTKNPVANFTNILKNCFFANIILPKKYKHEQ